MKYVLALLAGLILAQCASAQNVTVIGPAPVAGNIPIFNSPSVIKDSGVAGGAALFASPTGAVGLTTINGSASTALRSDAAPPLSASVQASLTATNGNILTGTGIFGFSSTATIPAANFGANVITNTMLAQMLANTVKCNNTGSTANAQDCTTLPSGLTIPSVASLSYTGTGSNVTAALFFNQTFNGSVSSNFQPFNITMNDNLAAGVNFVYPFYVNEVLNSASVTGTRPGFTTQLTFSAATGNASGAFYLGSSSVIAVGSSDNGTAGTPLSYAYGSNPWCHFLNGGTNWKGCIGVDAIAQLDTGSSAQRRVAVYAESEGNVRGSLIDAALDVWGPTFPWQTGIQFDDSTGPYPVVAGGTLLKASTSTNTIALNAGIDLSGITGTWTKDAILLPANNGGITWGTSGARVYSTATSGGGVILLSNGTVTLNNGASIQVHVDSNGLGFDYAPTTTCTVTASIQVTIQNVVHKIPYC